MHYKTTQLLELFPDAYATVDTESMLFKLLDSLGAELMTADGAIKWLLKSHWVTYAEGKSLDGLGATYGIKRRRLRQGMELFRQGLGWASNLDQGEVPERLHTLFSDRRFPLSSDLQVVVQQPSYRWLIEDRTELRAYAIRRELDEASSLEFLNVYLVTETDDAFRLRLKSIIKMLAGGGTIHAIRGAVRSSLGMPYDLQQLNIPPEFAALEQAIDNLIRVEEFSPQVDRLIGNQLTRLENGNTSQILLSVEADSIQEITPQIQWTFTQGGARNLHLERLGSNQGVRSRAEFIVPEGAILVLSSEPDGTLSALLDGLNVASAFTNLEGGTPARLPEIPRERSEWKFCADGGLWGVSTFDDGDIFGPPDFWVELRWERKQPLTFDVYVPYFFEEAVQRLTEQYGYTQEIFVFEGIPRDHIQTVVNQTKAAGIQGNVQFSLNFFENHDQQDHLYQLGTHATTERMEMADRFEVGSFNREVESHDVVEVFSIGGVFDIATFDGAFSFQDEED